MKRTYRISPNGRALSITVPKRILARLQWRRGTEVIIDEIDGRLVVTDVARHTEELLELRIREQIANHRRLA